MYNMHVVMSLNSVANAIRRFCQTAQIQKTTSWILVLPFLHFLERDSEPFEPNKDCTGNEFDSWAGLKSFRISPAHNIDSEHAR